MPIRPPVNILSPILLERDRLTYAIAQTIDHTFHAADTGCVGNAGEVDRLVYFFLDGLPLIEDQFNRILTVHGVRATLSGIFCHQTPKVVPDYNSSRFNSCELGDILFLVTYGRRLYGTIIGNAFLVQAKEDINTLHGSIQEYLYESAGEYRYTSPRSLAGKDRELDECFHSLWYWGFNSHWLRHHSSYPVRTIGLRARRPHVRRQYVPFENALMELIMGVNGRCVWALEHDSREAGWSKIVDDLIRVTARSAFHRQNAYISRKREPLRGEDAMRAVNLAMGSPAPFLIRSSLKQLFSNFDKEIANLGRKLESIGVDFDEDNFQQRNRSRYFSKEGESKGPPILGNERPSAPEDDDGGCSFVIMDFSRINNE